LNTVRESETISREDKQKKEFFGEWVHTKTNEELYSTPIEKLRNELSDYCKEKIITVDEL